MSAYYLDTSAAVRLVVDESGSRVLRSWIDREDPDFVSSDLLRVELLRVCRRHSPDAIAAARVYLDAVSLMPLTTELCQRASEIDPSVMRSLDALHVASALVLGDELRGVLTYDERLADGCRAYGLPVLSPA